MSTPSLISIIIAVYNGGKTLQRCLDSIAAQTYPNIELIVMDGASTDNTVDIIKHNQSIITYWESTPDNGIYHAWNKALDKSNGEWICFIGADNYWAHPGRLTSLLDYDPSQTFDLIASRIALVNDQDEILTTMGDTWDWDIMKDRQCVAHAGLLHHKRLFETHGHFNDRYIIAGDYDFLLRLGPNVKIRFVDQINLHMGDNGVSRSHLFKILVEKWHIQRSHADIGWYSATKDFIKAINHHYIQHRIKK